TNEVQVLTVYENTGSFTLTHGPDTTTDISTTNPSAAALQAALEALPSIGAGNVQVVMTSKGLDGSKQDVYTITFLTHKDESQLIAKVNSNVVSLFDAGKYTLKLTNPNLLVDENAQTDNLYMFDGDNPSDASGVFTQSTITGLGMPASQVIGGTTQPGGIN